MVINRGEVWWASLPIPKGSEPGYRRPLLIIQSDAFNRSRINTVIAVVLTSNIALSQAPGNVLLGSKQTGLSKKSVVNVSQILTVDKSFLSEKTGRLSKKHMQSIEEGLKTVLSLS